MELADITEKILLAAFEVNNELGCGFLESVYEKALLIALQSKGLNAVLQAPLKVRFRGAIVGDFFADLLIDNTIILELKACDSLVKAHYTQTLNYLKATNIEIGLLLNFGEKPEIKRLIFTNNRKN